MEKKLAPLHSSPIFIISIGALGKVAVSIKTLNKGRYHEISQNMINCSVLRTFVKLLVSDIL